MGDDVPSIESAEQFCVFKNGRPVSNFSVHLKCCNFVNTIGSRSCLQKKHWADWAVSVLDDLEWNLVRLHAPGASLTAPSVINVRFSALCNFVLLYLSLYACWYTALFVTMAASLPHPSLSLSSWSVLGSCPSSVNLLKFAANNNNNNNLFSVA